MTEYQADGTTTSRALDLYRRGCFVLEGKDTGKATGSDGPQARAHDTPRAYVERLVIPTVIEPLRADWEMAFPHSRPDQPARAGAAQRQDHRMP